MSLKSKPALFIHGGAGGRADRARAALLRRSLRAICERSYARLSTRSALDTVAFVVQQLEDDPLFNAGTGSVLQWDGRVRMSASVMDGRRGRFAGVLNIERVRNPVLVAQQLLDRPDRILAGPPATRFARAAGFVDWNPVTPERMRQWRSQHRTPQFGAATFGSWSYIL